jgi:hypothetical protein
MATDCVLCEKWTELLYYLDQVKYSKVNITSIPIYLLDVCFFYNTIHYQIKK